MLRVGRPILLAFTRVVCAQQQGALNFFNPLSPREARSVSFNTRGSSTVATDIDREAQLERKKAAGQARLLAKPPNPKEHRGSIAEPKRGVLPLNLSGLDYSVP